MQAFGYALLTALLWGIAPVIEKIGLRKIDASVGLFYRGFSAVIGMCVVGIICASTGTSLKAGWRPVSLVVCGGILASFIGQFCFYRALKLGAASQVVPVAAAFPLVSFVIAVLVLHESVTPGKILGIILVIAGVIFLK